MIISSYDDIPYFTCKSAEIRPKSKWSGKDKLDFPLRTLKRIAARIPLETCSPG